MAGFSLPQEGRGIGRRRAASPVSFCPNASFKSAPISRPCASSSTSRTPFQPVTQPRQFIDFGDKTPFPSSFRRKPESRGHVPERLTIRITPTSPLPRTTSGAGSNPLPYSSTFRSFEKLRTPQAQGPGERGSEGGVIRNDRMESSCRWDG